MCRGSLPAVTGLKSPAAIVEVTQKLYFRSFLKADIIEKHNCFGLICFILFVGDSRKRIKVSMDGISEVKLWGEWPFSSIKELIFEFFEFLGLIRLFCQKNRLLLKDCITNSVDTLFCVQAFCASSSFSSTNELCTEERGSF